MSSPGRNAPCPCGSGRRYKACCGRIADDGVAAPAAMPSSASMRALVLMLEAARYEDVEYAARELLQQHPDNGVLWQLLGASQRGRNLDALPALQRAAGLLPQDAVAHNNLANALASARRLEEAMLSYRRALELRPEFAEAQHNLGQALAESGRMPEAVDCYRRAVEVKPGFAAAWHSLGCALHALGRLDAAAAGHRRALEIQPGFAAAHHGLGLVLRDMDRLDEAQSCYRRALALEPDDADLHRDLASALRLEGRTAEVEQSCRRALELEPSSAAAVVVLAESQADRGRFLDAEALYRRAIAIEPDNPEAWAGLARLRPMTPADAEWLSEAQRIADSALPPRREVPLRYAIGKFFEDTRDYARAFEQFRRANELTKTYRAPHDREGLRRAIDALIERRQPRRLQCRRAAVRTHDSDASRAVFIVGMPRSGTSLAEQILASHRLVFGAGELAFWSRAAARPWPVDGPAERELEVLAQDYLGRLEGFSHDAHRVTDKMPSNFLHLGLIHAALPGARIIHMHRDPLDTCLSIYSQHFEGTHSYATDLDDLAHAYEQYRRLMRHWRQLLPAESLLEVPYEELVSEVETCSRRMVAFVGLDWDPQCLEFHRTERTVITASKWQVRQRVTKEPIGRWRHYREFIAPLLQRLA
jgi:tetratricopeptide (TPR) repeat protein